MSIDTNIKPYTKFRRWVYTVWKENCEEHLQYNEPQYTESQYWQKYRWWLRSRYQHLQRQGQL